MKLTAKQPGLLELQQDEVTLSVVFPDFDLKKLPEGIIIGAPLGEGITSSQGEYEYGGVGIIAVETKEDVDGNAGVFKVTIGEISCLVIIEMQDVLSKAQQDLVGNADLVIVNGSTEIKGMAKILNRFAPNYVIGFGFPDVKTAEKVVGHEVVETKDSITVKADELLDSDTAGVTFKLLQK